jgi:hypothetical protein
MCPIRGFLEPEVAIFLTVHRNSLIKMVFYAFEMCEGGSTWIISNYSLNKYDKYVQSWNSEEVVRGNKTKNDRPIDFSCCSEDEKLFFSFWILIKYYNFIKYACVSPCLIKIRLGSYHVPKKTLEAASGILLFKWSSPSGFYYPTFYYLWDKIAKKLKTIRLDSIL